MDSKAKVNNVQEERLHDGFFKVDKVVFDQTKHSGEKLEGVIREVFKPGRDQFLWKDIHWDFKYIGIFDLLCSNHLLRL